MGQSRMALIMNGFVKIPMQFSILFMGAILFIFYQFSTPPIFFSSVPVEQVKESAYSQEFSQLEQDYERISLEKSKAVRELARSFSADNPQLVEQNHQQVEKLQDQASQIRQQAIGLMQKNNPDMDPKDTNFVFLSFVLKYLPVGIVGLILAVIFSASMSSTASELNALASTTVIDIYKRVFKKDGDDGHYLWVSKLVTFLWGLYAILLAESASRLGSLIEAVNIVGSLFYGTILGIFLVGFYLKNVRGTATFYAAIGAELLVLCCFFFTDITFLWFNVIGCLGVIIFAMVLNGIIKSR